MEHSRFDEMHDVFCPKATQSKADRANGKPRAAGALFLESSFRAPAPNMRKMTTFLVRRLLIERHFENEGDGIWVLAKSVAII